MVKEKEGLGREDSTPRYITLWIRLRGERSKGCNRGEIKLLNIC